MNKITDTEKLKDIIKSVKGVVPKHCDACGHKYNDDTFNVVREDRQNVTMHIKCHNCNNAYMINIYNPVGGLIGSTRAKINLDLTDSQEIMEFAGSDSVSTDEAIDAYSLIVKSDALNNIIAESKSRQDHTPPSPQEIQG